MKRVKHSKFKMITITFSIAIIFSLILSGCPADTIKDSLTNTTPNNTSSTISTPTSEPIHTASNNLEVTYDEVKYNITASYSSGQDSSYGTFTSTNSNPDSHEVTLEATPKEGNGFIGWSSNINGDKIVSYYNPYKFVVTEDATLYPVFIKGDDTVELKDPKVKRDMGTILKKSTFTYSDLQEVTSFETYDIESLEDFKYFHSLKETYIHFITNKYYDTSYLANLVNLEIVIFHNSFVDLLPFENYKNLKRVNVLYSGENFSSLTTHKDTIESLSLESLNLTDYEFISEFQNLKILHIENSKFSENDLKYLTNSLENLSIVDIENIKDLSNLERLVNLKHLSVSECWLNNITPLGKLKNLEYLNLSNNLISDISPLSNLTKLKSLNITNNRITDLSSLEPLYSQSLSYVYMRFNQITDYSFLKNTTCQFETSVYTSEELAQAVSVAKNMVNNLIKPNMTDEEKYKTLAFELCRNVMYGSGSFAYDALINGTSVCDGYTEAYMLLCTMAGLPCYYIRGDISTDTSDNKSHVWNIVKIDTNYYHVDTTWMDDPSSVSELYFLKSDLFFNNNYHCDFFLPPDIVCSDISKDNNNKITYFTS